MRRLAIVCLLVLLCAQASPAATGTASLLLDTSRGTDEGNGTSGSKGPLLPAGPVALFTAAEPSSGGELWASDGTAGGTQGLRDICPGPCSTELVHAVGRIANVEVLYLDSQQEGSLGRLWRSDGTVAGTFPLGPPGNAPPRPCSGEGVTIGRVLFFAGATNVCDLWRTDGTAAGTWRVRELGQDFGGGLLQLAVLGGTLSFTAIDDQGAALWRSDGTDAGTVVVRRLSSPRFLTSVGTRLYFVDGGEGDELWTSDGTAAGTRPLTRFVPSQPFSKQTFFLGIDGILYFLADDVTGGLDLWRSDGTEAGTRRVTAFGNAVPFSNRFEEQQIAKLGSRLFFVATDGINGFRLWTSSGTPESTAPLACPGGPCPSLEPAARITKLGNRIVFPGSQAGKGGVWSTDGTAAGTQPLLTSCAPHCGPEVTAFAPLPGRVLFLLGDDRPGNFRQELWQTDGTAQGTRWLATLSLFDPYGPVFQPVAVGGRALFLVEGQLWASDGTPEGTGPVTRIGGGGFGSNPSGFASAGSTVWFAASDGQEIGLWRSGGTAETTHEVVSGFNVLDEHAPFLLSHQRAFFLRWDGTSNQLWRTDGTPAGLLALTPAGDEVIEFFPFQDRIACLIREPDGTRSLWDSDGTPAGTHRLLVLPWSNDLRVEELAVFGSDLLVVTVSFNTFEYRLWRTDGTAAGTRSIAGVAPRLKGAVAYGSRIFFPTGDQIYALDASDHLLQPLAGYRTNQLAVFGNALYFVAGNRLVRSDGTAQGSVVVKTFESDQTLGDYGFTPLGDRLYFAMNDRDHGTELWRTDGTGPGTVLVRDIVPGPGSSSPSELAAAGGRLFFNAADGVHGFELWESDGTEAGTRQVQDIAPGLRSAQPREMTEAAGHLFFSASDGARGRGPWALPLNTAPGCQPSDRVLCLSGGRFRVEIEWLGFERNAGPGHAVPLAADTGTFWFFSPANVEVVVKVLDGRGVNGHFWVFYGALSSVEYTLLVTDTQTGASRLYRNPLGRLSSVADTQAFGPLGASLPGRTLGPNGIATSPIVTASRTAAKAACAPSSTRLCLQGNRFAVEARWRDAQGHSGVGTAVPLAGGDTGYFWFFNAANVEVILKVLDGRPLNDKFWVFYGALSDVEYTLTVTDTQTGKVNTYSNRQGRLASVADTGAF